MQILHSCRAEGLRADSQRRLQPTSQKTEPDTAAFISEDQDCKHEAAFLLLAFRVRVIKSQVALAIKLLCLRDRVNGVKRLGRVQQWAESSSMPKLRQIDFTWPPAAQDCASFV